MSVKIIVDSTTDLLPEMKDRVEVVPLTVRFGSEEYIDGETMSHYQFYEKLIETDIMPQTSQAAPADFEHVFEGVHKNGDSAVVITVSASLSGTYQSACIAAENYKDIYVIDSATVAIGAGILTELALRYVDEGLPAARIAEILEQEKRRIRIIALLDTLEYLKKGGRISKTVAFAGGLLNIKPVVSIVNGEIILLGKARGSKQGNNLLVSEIAKSGGIDFQKPVLLGYTGLSDALLQKYIADSAALWENRVSELRTTIVGSVIGTHAGPGAIAAAYFA